MSLTTTDLQEIRNIVNEEVHPSQNELHALRNAIKEIYEMISDLQLNSAAEKEFDKPTIKKKILELNAKLVSVAKQAGITLPR